MKYDTFHQFLELLGRLKKAKIAYEIRHSRADALTIAANVPGERWEIEFVDYGDEVQIEIERFRSNGEIKDESLLEELFAKFADTDAEQTPQALKQKDRVARK